MAPIVPLQGKVAAIQYKVIFNKKRRLYSTSLTLSVIFPCNLPESAQTDRKKAMAQAPILHVDFIKAYFAALLSFTFLLKHIYASSDFNL